MFRFRRLAGDCSMFVLLQSRCWLCSFDIESTQRDEKSDRTATRAAWSSLLRGVAAWRRATRSHPPHPTLHHANWIRAHSRASTTQVEQQRKDSRRIRRAEKQPNGRTVKKSDKDDETAGAKRAAAVCFEEQREDGERANAWTDE